MPNNAHFRPNGRQPRQVPVTVEPSPVPMQFIVEQVQTGSGPMVLLRLLSPTGMGVYFLPAETAKQLADMLRQRATPVALA